MKPALHIYTASISNHKLCLSCLYFCFVARTSVARTLEMLRQLCAVQLLKADGWMKMMESLELVDDDFTLNNAMLCYVWCRMSTIDEVKDYSKFESLTFVDLLEALGQVANHKHLPLTSELQEAGIDSLQWVLAKASGVVPVLHIQGELSQPRSAFEHS